MLEVRPASNIFGGSPTTSRADLPKAKVWMNIGYSVEGTDAEGAKTSEFVSLPVGIPIDTTDALTITSRNERFAQFQSARNDLLSQLQAAAAELAPGEEKIVNLEIQLRRVNDAAVVPAADSTNPFARKVFA